MLSIAYTNNPSYLNRTSRPRFHTAIKMCRTYSYEAVCTTHKKEVTWDEVRSLSCPAARHERDGSFAGLSFQEQARLAQNCQDEKDMVDLLKLARKPCFANSGMAFACTRKQPPQPSTLPNNVGINVVGPGGSGQRKPPSGVEPAVNSKRQNGGTCGKPTTQNRGKWNPNIACLRE